MSKGTKAYAVRLPVSLVKEVELTIARRNLWRQQRWFNADDWRWNLSQFIRICLQREIRKMERSRQPRKRRSE